jgi:hypothetical protein
MRRFAHADVLRYRTQFSLDIAASDHCRQLNSIFSCLRARLQACERVQVVIQKGPRTNQSVAVTVYGLTRNVSALINTVRPRAPHCLPLPFTPLMTLPRVSVDKHN